MVNQPHPNPARRQVLKGVGVLGGLVVAGGFGWTALRNPDTTDHTPTPGPAAETELEALARSAVSGGPGRDGIPSIDRPRFVSAQEASFLSDREPVFGLRWRGVVRAYPQQVLVWHEIVNDTVDGERLAVTYCPLTGTAIGFTGMDGRSAMTFGTTGRLVNSNLLMYDRETDSEWPQVLGVAISGELTGQRLRMVPLVWSSWGAWRTRHPDTVVLSTDTGSLRTYGRDPYGSYPDESGYYVDGGPFFPVRHTDDRFPPKDVVVGVRAENARLAIHKELIRRERGVDARVGDVAVLARWDDDLDTAWVERQEDGRPADFLDAMWFAWHAFYPDSGVLS